MMHRLSLLFLFLLAPFTLFSMSKAEDCRKIVIMLGAPGAGKGTQAVIINEEFHLPHISTGDLFRDNIRRHTEIGEKVKDLIEAGQFVPDTIVLEMLYDRIKEPDCAKGFILDGCPRTVNQAEALDKHLSCSQILALNLDVPDELIIERIAARLTSEQRSDDNPEVVKERLLLYHKESAPLIDYYMQSDRLINIDGTKGKEAISCEIRETLCKFI